MHIHQKKLIQVPLTVLQPFRTYLQQIRDLERPPDMVWLFGNHSAGISYILIDSDTLSKEERQFLIEHGAQEVEGITFQATESLYSNSAYQTTIGIYIEERWTNFEHISRHGSQRSNMVLGIGTG